MIIFLLILLVISLINIRISPKNDYFKNDYLCKNQTTSIKGIFAILIVLVHSLSYIELNNNIVNSLYSAFLTSLNQLLVACFFFYSSYGIAESFKKNDTYFTTFPLNRIFRTLLTYDFFALFYIIYYVIIGSTNYNWVLSLLTITSLGNGNWFIFAILISYIIVYIGFLIFKNLKHITSFSFIMTFIYSISICIIMKYKGLPYNYYINTIFCFPFGLLFSLNKEKIEQFVFEKKHYITTFIIVFCIFIITYILQRFVLQSIDPLFLTYNLCSISFMSLIILFNAKVKLYNRIIHFLGKYSFGIYLIQMLIMKLVQKYFTTNPYFFTTIVLVLTLISAVFLTIIINALLSKLSKKERNYSHNNINVEDKH